MGDTGWTFRTLFKHFSTVIDERDKRYDQRFSASQEAIGKAERAHNQQLRELERLKDVTRDEVAAMVTRAEYDARHSELEKSIELVNLAMERTIGQRQGREKVVASLVGVFAIAASIITAVITHAIVH